MLTPFDAVGSCALASHIAPDEAGAEYETVRPNFAANDQRKPEYLKINPKGRVPALVADAGILTETPAMNQAAYAQAGAVKRAEAVAFASGLPWEAFGKDTESGDDTRALPGIWQQMDQCKSRQDLLRSETRQAGAGGKVGRSGSAEVAVRREGESLCRLSRRFPAEVVN